MKTNHWFMILTALLVLASSVAYAQDNEPLQKIFEQDQRVREAVKNGASPPRVADELQRRVQVFGLIADEKLTTGNDYIRALIILQHTTLEHTESGGLKSMSPENHVLAFQLARRAHELGHEKGAHFLVWTYNYYLQGVGCDPEVYGFDLIDGRAEARSKDLTAEQRLKDCGWFEPGDVYQSLGLTKD